MHCSTMKGRSSFRRHGTIVFDLLLILTAGVTVAAAVTPPREKPTDESALAQNVQVLRSALDLYQTEHNGEWPQANGAVTVSNLLVQYSNIEGTIVSNQKDVQRGVIYGPYLRTIPPLTVGQRRGSTGIAAAGAAGIGWIYNSKTGDLRANSLGKDASGKPYAEY